jgi:hypothetical protein
MLTITIDYRRIRAVLAHNQISHKHFAKVCNLSPVWISYVLNGRKPGELALIKITNGLAKLGLDGEVANAK